jgi:hypothetical protein
MKFAMSWPTFPKFPIVPRSIYEDVKAQLERSERERRRLTRTIVKMKVAGGSIPRIAQGVRLAPAEYDPFEEAIANNKHAASRPAVRKALQDFVAREQKKNTRPEKILEALRTWNAVRSESSEDDESLDDDNDTIAFITDDDDDPPVRGAVTRSTTRRTA